MNDQMLYLECYSGISGDMTVAALLDLGADPDLLYQKLNSLNLSGFQIKINRRKKNGIEACDFDVILEEPNKEFSHPERNLYQIEKILDSASLTDHSRHLAKKIFRIVAEAESKAHGVPIEQVYFHETGAMDSIVDIVSTSVCLDNLGISKVIFSDLYEGVGQIRYRYGTLPIPVPAVSNIINAYHLPLRVTSIESELITPTGAAIAAGIRTEKKLPKQFTIKRIGLGAGKREYVNGSGLLRAMLIQI